MLPVSPPERLRICLPIFVATAFCDFDFDDNELRSTVKSVANLLIHSLYGEM